MIHAPGDPSRVTTFSDGNLHMDFEERMVILDRRPASLRNRAILRPIESGVLSALVKHQGETLSASQLSEMVWGKSDEEAVKTVVKVIARLQFILRSMDLEDCPIETVQDGYRYRSWTP